MGQGVVVEKKGICLPFGVFGNRGFTRLYETSLLPNRFTTLVEGKRSGAVRRFYARRTDFSALDGDAFLAVVGCRGLQSFQAQRSVFPSGCVVDDLIRSCAANGVLELHFRENRCEPALRFSDDAVLDFCYQTNAAPVRRPISLELDVIGVSDLFLAKFFERLLASDVRPSGRLVFYGAPKQRDLSAYAHLAWDTRYRFSLRADDTDAFYEVVLWEPSPNMQMWFRAVRLSS